MPLCLCSFAAYYCFPLYANLSPLTSGLEVLDVNIMMIRVFLPSLSMLPLLVLAVFLREAGKIGLMSFLVVLFSLLSLQVFCFYRIFRGCLEPMKNIRNVLVSFLKTKTLEKVIPKEGCEDMKSMISCLNKMMLELQAYNSFHLDQVIDERNKSDTIINLVPDALVLMGPGGRFMHCNSPFLRLLDIGPGDGMECSGVKSPRFKEIFAGIMASPEKEREVELECPDVNRTYLFLSNRFMLASLRLEGIIIIIKDITLEKEIARSKENFFHMITHDMRAPLSAIKGYREMLMVISPPEPREKTYFDHMAYSEKKLAGMIDDILNTAKLENGRMILNLSRISVSGVLNSAKENQTPVAQLKKIKISVDFREKDLEICADGSLVERILANLLTNAIKFTPQDGEISLGARGDNGYCEMWVEDTGPGIPENEKDAVFKKYVQMKEHRNQGFGIGLAMCRMAVELHNGTIWVESEAGKGSKFVFRLPINGRLSDKSG